MHVKSTILISNCKLWISLFFELKRYMTVFFMMMVMTIIIKTLLRMLHLTPCTLALLNKAAATALGAGAFSRLVPSSWGFFPFFFLPLPFFVFCSAHCIGKFSVSDI